MAEIKRTLEATPTDVIEQVTTSMGKRSDLNIKY